MSIHVGFIDKVLSLPKVSEENACPTYLNFGGDYQFHRLPWYSTWYRSMLANDKSFGTAVRLMGQLLGVGTSYTELSYRALDRVPAECQDNFHNILMGDLVDVNRPEEWDYFFQVLKSLPPLFQKALIVIPGNHEIYHSGVSNGFKDNGIISTLFKISALDFVSKLVVPEIGGMDRLTNKFTLLEYVHQLAYKETNPSQPVFIDPDSDLFEGPSEKINETLWRQMSPNQWLCSFTAQKIIHSPEDENEAVIVSAARIGNTKEGSIPVYMIGLDSMDLSDVGDVAYGALEGYVSSRQVRVVQSFMDARLAENPKTQFIFASHYQAGMIENAHASGLSQLLDDYPVFAFFAAHVHRRDFKNLAEDFGLEKKKYLPEITVPSAMDWPAESVLAEMNNTNGTVTMKINFVAQQDATALSSDLEVLYNGIVGELNSYRQIVDHITDPKLRRLVDREYADIATQFKNFLNVDGGVRSMAHPAAHVVAHDSIYAMYFSYRLFLKISTLAYLASSKTSAQEATHLAELIDQVHSVFEDAHQGRYASVRQDLNAIRQALQALSDMPNKDAAFLNLISLTDRMAEWTLNYSVLRQSGQPDQAYLAFANLFQDPKVDAIFKWVYSFKRDSKPYQLMHRIFMYSIEQWKDFYPDPVIRPQVADEIMIEVDENGRVMMKPIPEVLSEEEIGRNFRNATDKKTEELDAPSFHVDLVGGGDLVKKRWLYGANFRLTNPFDDIPLSLVNQWSALLSPSENSMNWQVAWSPFLTDAANLMALGPSVGMEQSLSSDGLRDPELLLGGCLAGNSFAFNGCVNYGLVSSQVGFTLTIDLPRMLKKLFE